MEHDEQLEEQEFLTLLRILSKKLTAFGVNDRYLRTGDYHICLDNYGYFELWVYFRFDSYEPTVIDVCQSALKDVTLPWKVRILFATLDIHSECPSILIFKDHVEGFIEKESLLRAYGSKLKRDQ